MHWSYFFNAQHFFALAFLQCSAMLSPAQLRSAALSCAQLRSTALNHAQPCTAKNKWNSIPELQRATILGTVRDHFTKVGKWHFSKTYIYITCPKFDLSVSFYTIIINFIIHRLLNKQTNRLAIRKSESKRISIYYYMSAAVATSHAKKPID